MTGVFAAMIALPSISSLYPHPSKMIRTSGETDPVFIKDSSLLSTCSLLTWNNTIRANSLNILTILGYYRDRNVSQKTFDNTEDIRLIRQSVA